MTDTPKYIHLVPGEPPPTLQGALPFKAVLVIEADVAPDWQEVVSNWLVRAGCLYVMAWGRQCSEWHDCVDYANLRIFDFGEIPQDKFVMTTWHTDEPLNEVFWFAAVAVDHADVALDETYIVHIAANERSAELLQLYLDCQNQ